MNSTTPVCSVEIWTSIRTEAEDIVGNEPALAPLLQQCILDHQTFGGALACILSGEVSSDVVPKPEIFKIFLDAMADDPEIEVAAATDIQAHVDRDPASSGYLSPFLYYKGYHALQVYRIANWLWKQGRESMALYLQGRASREYDVDIHPAATIGRGIMIDHGSGLVIGETAVVEDDVSMLHGVTLGGTGKESGDRHPKIRRGVLLSAGARILGNIEVGEGAKVGASSLVLTAVPPHTTYAGVPAKEVGKPKSESPALSMNQDL